MFPRGYFSAHPISQIWLWRTLCLFRIVKEVVASLSLDFASKPCVRG
jgi:hypothetical protein